MIATLSGVITAKEIDHIVLETGGVGYRVVVADPDHGRVQTGQDAQLYIHEVVREDAYDLYGFTDSAARSLFQQLLGVSGVGPKAALAILSLADSSQVQSAIVTGDSAFLESASGIGKRTAERIAIELKDKVVATSGSVSASGGLAQEDAALQGLEALGYPRSVAATALAKVSSDIKDDSERIKQALKEI